VSRISTMKTCLVVYRNGQIVLIPPDELPTE
jgi:hypothetical protein